MMRKSYGSIKENMRIGLFLSRLFQIYEKKETKENSYSKKQGFVRFIANCISKNKLERFLDRQIQRLKEKGFDKIKQYNWSLEEKKLVLEDILKV